MNALGNKYTPHNPLPPGHQTQQLNPLAKPYIPSSSPHRREPRNIASYDIHFPPLESVPVFKQTANDTELPTLPESASTRRDAQSVGDLYKFLNLKNLRRIPEDIKLYGSALSAREVMMEERSDLGKLWNKLNVECRMTDSTESYRVYEMLNLVEIYLNPFLKKKFKI